MIRRKRRPRASWISELADSSWIRDLSEEGREGIGLLIEAGCERRALVALLNEFRVASLRESTRTARRDVRSLLAAIDRVCLSFVKVTQSPAVLICGPELFVRAAVGIETTVEAVMEAFQLTWRTAGIDQSRSRLVAYVKQRTRAYHDDSLGELLAELGDRSSRPSKTSKLVAWRRRAVAQHKQFRRRKTNSGVIADVVARDSLTRRRAALAGLRSLLHDPPESS